MLKVSRNPTHWIAIVPRPECWPMPSLDPIRPTEWHVVVVMGLATHRGSDQCYFMIRDPAPMKYQNVVAFEFNSFKSKLVSLNYCGL